MSVGNEPKFVRDNLGGNQFLERQKYFSTGHDFLKDPFVFVLFFFLIHGGKFPSFLWQFVVNFPFFMAIRGIP